MTLGMPRGGLNHCSDPPIGERLLSQTDLGQPSDLDPELDASAVCQTFTCVDALSARLFEKAKQTDDPKSEVETAVEAVRLTTGAGQP